jgi:hypothetical protein
VLLLCPWGREPKERAVDPAQRLIAAGLIEEYGFALQPTARCDATFEPPRLCALYGR